MQEAEPACEADRNVEGVAGLGEARCRLEGGNGDGSARIAREADMADRGHALLPGTSTSPQRHRSIKMGSRCRPRPRLGQNVRLRLALEGQRSHDARGTRPRKGRDSTAKREESD
jgi:hypothetical protein